MAATFHFFAALPAELRNSIWHAALPESIVGPSLYFYRDRRYWCGRRLAESEEGYIAGSRVMGIKFRSDLLECNTQFHVPLVFVNQEARGIALAWLQEEGITPQQHQHAPCLFARPFDGASDVLYVADDRWLKFYFEPTDRMAEPDLINQNLDLSSDLTRVAVSETLFMRADMIVGLPEIQVWFMHLTVIFVVVGAQPDEIPGPRRWQLDNTKGGAFRWHVGDEAFRFERGPDAWMEEDVYARIGEAANGGLREEMRGQPLHHQNQGLEIRPIFVSRK